MVWYFGLLFACVSFRYVSVYLLLFVLNDVVVVYYGGFVLLFQLIVVVVICGLFGFCFVLLCAAWFTCVLLITLI